MVVRFPGPTGRVVRSLWAMGSLAKQVVDRKFAIRSFPFFVCLSNPFGGATRGFLGRSGTQTIAHGFLIGQNSPKSNSTNECSSSLYTLSVVFPNDVCDNLLTQTRNEFSGELFPTFKFEYLFLIFGF